MVEQEMPQITLWRRIECWISKVQRAQAHALARAPTLTHAHALTHARARMRTEICNTFCFSMTTVVSWKRLNITLCIYWLSCFFLPTVYTPIFHIFLHCLITHLYNFLCHHLFIFVLSSRVGSTGSVYSLVSASATFAPRRKPEDALSLSHLQRR
jgi:membrane-associated HD superfamily phosphohydrolase